MMCIFFLADSSHNLLDLICILYIQACLSCCRTALYDSDTDNSRILHHIHTRISCNIPASSSVFYKAHTFFVHFLISSCILPVLDILHPDICFLFDPYIFHSILYMLKRKIRYHVCFPQHIRLPAQIRFCHKTFDVNMQNIFPFPLYGNSRFPDPFCSFLYVLFLCPVLIFIKIQFFFFVLLIGFLPCSSRSLFISSSRSFS